MTNLIKEGCWAFYLEGRGDKRLKNDLDPDRQFEVIQAMATSPVASFRDAVREACEAAAAPLREGRAKARWLAGKEAAIAESADGAAVTDEIRSDAYNAYLCGRVDKLAHAIENQMLDALEEVVDPEGDMDEEGDSDEDEEDEDEEDEEEDDEEDDDGVSAATPRTPRGRR